jgi:uncharacterized membrane protein
MRKDLRYNYAALGLCAVACCVWSYVLALKYYRLSYTSWDLPLYANLMWNLCHGSLSTSLYEGNFLRDHFNIIAFLLVPFYYFFQSALTLLYFKLFAFFAGAYVFYLLCAKRMGGLWAIAFMLAYMFYPANVAMLFFEFNFENLALPLIFLLFYYFEEEKFLSFIVCSLLLAAAKENMPLIVFMFGIYAFLSRRQDRLRWGLCPFFLGGGIFIATIFMVVPWLRHGLKEANGYLYFYSKLGHSPQEIVRTFIFKMPEVFKILFNGRNVSFLLQLFGPLLVTALLGLPILLIAAPLFLQNLLSQFPGQQSVDYFYASTMVVFIFMATIDFLGRINFKFKGYLLLFIIGLLFVFDLKQVPNWIQKVPPVNEKQEISRYLLSKIPPDAKVAASYKFMYMLSQRKDLYALFLEHNKFTSKREWIPDAVDYIAVDFTDREDNRHYVENILSRDRWKVQLAADEVILLRKDVPRGERLIIRRGVRPFPWRKPSDRLMVDDALKMEGLDVPMSLKFGQRTMRIVFYWEVLRDDGNTSLPQISLSIFQGPRNFYSKDRAPFYGLPLRKGGHYEEVFYYLVPKLSPGRYTVVISSVPAMRRNSLAASGANVCIKNISVSSPNVSRE